MNEFLNKNKIKLVVLALAVVMLVTSASYAWFTATVRNDGNPESNVVTTGNMEITYSDGQIIGTPTNMIPGQEITKDFTIRNTGNVDTEYVIYLSEVNNSFNPTTDLEYKLEKLSTNGYEKVYTVCPTTPTAINNVAIQLANNDTHEYRLTIKFKETNANQDTNKGRKFSAKISVNEYKNAIISVNYDARGGVSSKVLDNIESGTSLTQLPTVTKSQDEDYTYTFDGWYDAPTGGTQVTTSTTFIADTTIYAHYTSHARRCEVQVEASTDSNIIATYSCVDGSGTMNTCPSGSTVCDGGNGGEGNKLNICRNTGSVYLGIACNNSLGNTNPVSRPGLSQNITCSCD